MENIRDDTGQRTNYRPDVELYDEDLIMIDTKELNKILKKNNIGKSRQSQIKQERRTLKNRGYAYNCRVKREEEVKKLEDEIYKIRLEIKQYESLDYYDRAEQYLLGEIAKLQTELHINGEANGSTSSPIKKEIVVKEET